MAKTVLIATGIFPPQIGGPATYAKLLADALPERGVNVIVESFGEVLSFPKIVRHFVYGAKLFWHGRKANTFFVQDTVSVGLPALIVSKILRKKMILRVPGDYAWEQGVQRFEVKESIDEFQDKKTKGVLGFLRSIQKFVATHADTVIVPSEYFKSVVLKWGVLDSKLRVVYNGIEKFVYKEGVALEAQKDGFAILTAGRMVPWKGFKELVYAFKDIKEVIPEATLCIVGSGPEEQNILNAIKETGLSQCIKTQKSLPREELFGLIKKSSVFVLNSGFESFSFQAVEAMALRAVVVATRTGSLEEIICDGVTGFLFSPGDTDALKKKIIEVYKNPEGVKRVSLAAREEAKKYSFDNTVNKLIGLI